MTLSETVSEVISGEILTVDVDFCNIGPVTLKNLYLAVSHPECMAWRGVVGSSDNVDDFGVLYDEKYRPPPDFTGIYNIYFCCIYTS